MPESNDVSEAESTKDDNLLKTYKRANTDPQKIVRFSIKRRNTTTSAHSFKTSEESQGNKKSKDSKEKSLKHGKKSTTSSAAKRVSFKLPDTKKYKTQKSSRMSVNSFTTDDDFEESTKFDHESHR